MPFFLPLHERHWRNRGRQFRSYLPLFPGYVFLRGTADERLKALETNLVANVLANINTTYDTALARLELKVMIEETLARYPRMRLAGPPTYVESPFINQLKTLPVRLDS